MAEQTCQLLSSKFTAYTAPPHTLDMSCQVLRCSLCYLLAKFEGGCDLCECVDAPHRHSPVWSCPHVLDCHTFCPRLVIPMTNPLPAHLTPVTTALTNFAPLSFAFEKSTLSTTALVMSAPSKLLSTAYDCSTPSGSQKQQHQQQQCCILHASCVCWKTAASALHQTHKAQAQQCSMLRRSEQYPMSLVLSSQTKQLS